jgi:hypothetical protein
VRNFLLLAIALICAWIAVAQAQVWVHPSTRRDGTQVQDHWRSNADGNSYNNWSYPGNLNPLTLETKLPEILTAILEQQYQNRNNGQNQYQDNPYQRR